MDNGFADLAARFLRIDESDPKRGNYFVKRIAAQAAKEVAKIQGQGIALCDYRDWPAGESFITPDDEIKAWAQSWLMVCMELEGTHPHCVPPGVGVPANFNVAGPAPGDTILGHVVTATYLPAAWKQRAEDYAAVCKLLAERIDQENAVSTANTFKVFFADGVQPDVRAMAQLLADNPNMGVNESARQIARESPGGLYQRFKRKLDNGSIRFDPPSRIKTANTRPLTR